MTVWKANQYNTIHSVCYVVNPSESRTMESYLITMPDVLTGRIRRKKQSPAGQNRP